MQNTLKLWHGGRFKEGLLEIGRGKKDRCEHGPGIYCSTSISTAAKYAKGGGRITLIELDPNIGWINDKMVKFSEVIDFVKETPRLKNRKGIMEDVLISIRRSGKDDGTIFASVLLNLCHYHGALVGEPAQRVAEFYKDRGIHASLVRQGNEDWVVIHDTSKIVATKHFKGDDAYDLGINEFESISNQLKQLQSKTAVAEGDVMKQKPKAFKIV